MFEYWFYGHDSLNPGLVHSGSTNDWLQFCADVAKFYSPKVLGEFVNELFDEMGDRLDFIRIGDWNFEHAWGIPDPSQSIPLGEDDRDIECKIVINKVA